MSKTSRNDPCPCGSGKKYKKCCLGGGGLKSSSSSLRELQSSQQSVPDSGVSAQRRVKSTPEILQRVRDTLLTAHMGFNLIREAADPQQRMSGIRNVVVFGRAVTNVLQNLRRTEPTFDEWYLSRQEEMRNDPLAKFMYNLRTKILKEGELQTLVSMEITGDPMAAMRKFPKPPHAKAFFIGDSIGGSGWTIEVPNGDEEKYYVNLPRDIPGLHLDIQLHFAEAPPEFGDTSILELCDQYLQMLDKLVADAEQKFRKKSPRANMS